MKKEMQTPVSGGTDSLFVYHDHVRVGTLKARSLREGGYLLLFSYDPHWRRFPLSPHLPLGQTSQGAPVWNFFLNLLPEGHVLEDVAYRMNLRVHDVFGFLRQFGRDCPGAISLLSPDTEPEARAFYVPIEVERLRRHLPDGPTDAKREYSRQSGRLFMFGGKPRMSLAGAQDKLGVMLSPEGEFLLPEGTAPSTHILKSSCGKEFPFCVLNEHLIMRLASSIGLPVPRSKMLRLPEPVYVIRRFDRKREGRQWFRLHQIDMCQFFDVPNGMKYEEGSYTYAPEGLTLKDCFTFARAMSEPEKACQDVLKWCCYNYLVGNTDAHAKNISALVDEQGLHPAPFYDLLCVRAYGDEYTRMAFSIGGEDHLSLINEDCWRGMAKECGLTQEKVLAELHFQASRLPEAFSNLVVQETLSEEEREFAERIRNTINDQCRKVEAVSVQEELEEEGPRP